MHIASKEATAASIVSADDVSLAMQIFGFPERHYLARAFVTDYLVSDEKRAGAMYYARCAKQAGQSPEAIRDCVATARRWHQRALQNIRRIGNLLEIEERAGA